MSVEEATQSLESEAARARDRQSIDTERLKMLFAPTGAIQEIARENGWGDDFLRISRIIDQSIDTGE